MKQSRYRPLFRVAFYALLLVLAQSVAGIAVLALHGGIDILRNNPPAQADELLLDLMDQYSTETLLVSYALVFLMLLIIALGKKQDPLAFAGFKHKTCPALVLLGVGLGMAAVFWTSIAVAAIPWPRGWMETYGEAAAGLETAHPWLDLLAVGIFGPLTEEVLFREKIYRNLCLAVPAGAAAVLQGILFGGVHGTAVWMIYAGFMGILFGYVRKRTGSLWPCIAAHMSFNLGSYAVSWYLGGEGLDLTLVFVVSALALMLCLYGIAYRTRDKANS